MGDELIQKGTRKWGKPRLVREFLYLEKPIGSNTEERREIGSSKGEKQYKPGECLCRGPRETYGSGRDNGKVARSRQRKAGSGP